MDMRNSKPVYSQIPPQELLPRERAKRCGIAALTDRELFALLLGSGNKQCGVLDLALRLQRHCDKTFDFSDIEKLQSISGIGMAKAALIAAAFELARRYLYPPKKIVSSPKDVVPFLIHYGDRAQETFLSVLLNGANEIIRIRPVTTGLLNRTLIHPREVFADAVRLRANAVIAAHNHPSGRLTPSEDDKKITEALRKAGDLLGIKILDHIVFNGRDYFSFLEHGLIE